MKKSYSNFTVDDIRALGISTIRESLFEPALHAEPSAFLLQTLAIHHEIPSESEKAKSELLITPILLEMRMRNPKKMTYFSGYSFNVDSKRGLMGFCDFLVSGKHNAAFIESPIIAIVAAKHHQDLLDAAPQCMAEMYAAQLFNERSGAATRWIYGAVSNGHAWLFIRLEQQQAVIDKERYALQNLPRLLGVWQFVLEAFGTP
jgi:hypothetical protein